MDEMVDRLLDILADKLTERLSAGHKELYTAKELAERYGVSCATIRSKMAAGEFGELVSVGERTRLVPWAGVQAYESTHTGMSTKRTSEKHGVKADKTEFVSFSIPATGWKTDSSVPGYTNYIDIAISGLTAADYVAVDVAPSSSAVARAANFVATESRAGILRLRAASVPTAAISAQYHIITAATAAKEG